jgi:uncharacterized membrane protein
VIGGLELHPSVVHFPIALAVTGALFSVLYLALRREWLRWFAPILLSLALLGAVAAYFSGQSAEDRAEEIGVPHDALEEHESAGIWALGTIALACLLSWATHAPRRGVWIATLIAVIAVAATLRAGHLGGQLVFVHGAGRVQEAPGAHPAGDEAH